MCEIIVLFEGYSTLIDEFTMDANCSCTLIIAPDKNIIVDTMTAWDKQDIINGLAKHNIKTEQINYVVCSHSHADHIGNNNLFLKADEHIVGTTVHHNTLFREKNIKSYDYTLSEGVRILATPGHTAEDVTVMVNGKFNGEEVIVGITGDLFEKEEDLKEPLIWMNLGTPALKEIQAASRYRVAKEANIIIPGHGQPFRVTDEIREILFKQLEQIKSKEL